jgi:hypothetical protein
VTRICADNPTLWRGLPEADKANGTATANGTTSTVTRPHPGGVDPVGADRPALPARWEADRHRLLAARRRRPVTSATAVAEHAAGTGGDGSVVTPVDPGWPDSPLVQWEHADVPRQIGRAVHGALADLDLSTHCDAAGRSADEVARSRALTHAVAAHAPEVAAMVHRALTSPTVGRAASRPHWREVSVTTAVGPHGVLEGFVDLLFDDVDGLVVVDYKTDRITHGHGLGTSVATYRIQVAAYAAALESSTGRPVSRCVLVFVGPDAGAGDGAGRPWEHVITGPDLVEARAEALRVAHVLVDD